MDKPIVLIIGALTSIGRATALAFADSGACLVVPGRREAELRKRGLDAAFIRADVRHDDDVRNPIDQTVSRFGRIDAAINNAGTEGQSGLIARMRQGRRLAGHSLQQLRKGDARNSHGDPRAAGGHAESHSKYACAGWSEPDREASAIIGDHSSRVDRSSRFNALLWSHAEHLLRSHAR